MVLPIDPLLGRTASRGSGLKRMAFDEAEDGASVVEGVADNATNEADSEGVGCVTESVVDNRATKSTASISRVARETWVGGVGV